MGLGPEGNPYPLSVHVAPVHEVDLGGCSYASHPKWSYLFTADGELAETRLDSPHPHRNPNHEWRSETGESNSGHEPPTVENQPAQQWYDVSVEIRERGELRAASVAVVLAYDETIVSEDGEAWFELRFSVFPTERNRIEFEARYESKNSRLAPIIEMDVGRTARMSVDDIEITVTIVPAAA